MRRARSVALTLASVAALVAVAVAAAGDAPSARVVAAQRSVKPGASALPGASRNLPGVLPPPVTDRRFAADFLHAWRRSLTTSWALDETVRRTTRTGLHVAFALRRAQRPPDRLSVGGGSVDLRLGDQTKACATASGKVQCRSAGTATTYGQSVDAELATLASYVDGRQPLYAVVERDNCFELDLRIPRYPVPPYGRLATFCFDIRTGAPAGSTVQRAEATDVTVVEAIHSPATDADLIAPTDEQIARGAKSP